MSTPEQLSTLSYDPRHHAYQKTDDYLFSQLIPYIGSKRKLLGLIDNAVSLTGVTEGTFADFFAGSGVVSRYAKSRGFTVVANDWEPYSLVLNSATVALNSPPCASTLLDRLNALPGRPGFVTEHYCPADDQMADPAVERMYFTRSNGMRIDAIRETLSEWSAAGEIDIPQLQYLLAPLICAASFISNTSGLFKAYHNGWGGRTGTAHYRILSDLILKPVQLLDNGKENTAVAMDAADLARQWRDIVGDQMTVAYLDPPYNQHPYGSNYHLLNTIALWDQPHVPPIAEAKSAIRLDWRTERRSRYNYHGLALSTLLDLIDHIDCRWILLSYSTDGNISVDDLIKSCSERGSIKVIADSYKRYRVSTQRMSQRSHNVEFVVVLDKLGRPGTGKLEGEETISGAFKK